MDQGTLEWFKLGGSALAGAAGAGWALFTWFRKQRDKARRESEEREEERRKQSQVYVSPVLLAANALQSRLYNILELDGLNVLRVRQGNYAEEILYQMALYFGRDYYLREQGPYVRDSTARDMSEAVRESFATDRYGLGPFCVFRPDQDALGQLAVRRTEKGYEAISLYDFKEKIGATPYSEFGFLKDTLIALRNARNRSELVSHDRLVEVQNRLVDFLEYLERREGYSVFSGQRSKAVASGL
jgi:hypothetical protein